MDTPLALPTLGTVFKATSLLPRTLICCRDKRRENGPGWAHASTDCLWLSRGNVAIPCRTPVPPGVPGCSFTRPAAPGAPGAAPAAASLLCRAPGGMRGLGVCGQVCGQVRVHPLPSAEECGQLSGVEPCGAGPGHGHQQLCHGLILLFLPLSSLTGCYFLASVP